MPGATLLTLTSSYTLDRSRYPRSQISSGYIATRLHRHSTSAPGATLLTLTSSSTLDRSRYLRSQIISGYIAIRLERHQGHSARSHAAHLDEFVYSGQVTLPEESDQLRLHCHSATSPLGLSARSHAAHLDEFVYSGQVTLPEESDQIRLHCHSATSPLGLSSRSHAAHLDEYVYSGRQQLKLTSSAKNRPCSLRNQFNSCKSDDGVQQLATTNSPFHTGRPA